MNTQFIHTLSKWEIENNCIDVANDLSQDLSHDFDDIFILEKESMFVFLVKFDEKNEKLVKMEDWFACHPHIYPGLLLDLHIFSSNAIAISALDSCLKLLEVDLLNALIQSKIDKNAFPDSDDFQEYYHGTRGEYINSIYPALLEYDAMEGDNVMQKFTESGLSDTIVRELTKLTELGLDSYDTFWRICWFMDVLWDFSTIRDSPFVSTIKDIVHPILEDFFEKVPGEILLNEVFLKGFIKERALLDQYFPKLFELIKRKVNWEDAVSAINDAQDKWDTFLQIIQIIDTDSLTKLIDVLGGITKIHPEAFIRFDGLIYLDQLLDLRNVEKCKKVMQVLEIGKFLRYPGNNWNTNRFSQISGRAEALMHELES